MCGAVGRNIGFFLVLRLAAAIAALACAVVVAAEPVVTVSGVRTWAAPDHTRVVLDISARTNYKYFQLQHPRRLIVDLPLADIPKGIAIPDIVSRDLFLKRIRHGRHKGSLRLVLDLKSDITPDIFVLEPHQRHSHRLVIDLLEPQQKVMQVKQATASPTPPLPATATTPSAPLANQHAPALQQHDKAVVVAPGTDNNTVSPPLEVTINKPLPDSQDTAPTIGRESQNNGERELTVVIDAGHGGDDPGAIGGRYGTREKDVVLQIAGKLAQLVDAEPGMRAVQVRGGDYFVTLGNRVRTARNNKADIFVSIHADSFRDPSVKGSSVYVLSRKRATSEQARLLADRENASDLVGGVNIAARDDLVAAVLIDLSQTAAMQASNEAALDILHSMGMVGATHKKRVEAASFMVLGAPDVPSVLVETGFISNPDDELKLRDESHQQKLAQSIFTGLHKYFSRRPPEGSIFADMNNNRAAEVVQNL